MTFERIVLQRGKQQLILRCTIHGGKKEAYEELREEMNDLRKLEFIVLAERVRGKIAPDATKNEKRIAELLKLGFSLIPKAAAESNLTSQKHSIKYPDGVIYADITFAECVNWLHNRGLKVRCWVLPLLKSPAGQECLNEITKMQLLKANGQKSKLSFWFMARNYFRAILLMIGLIGLQRYLNELVEYRNKVAVARIELYRDNPDAKILLHYGRKHKLGLLKLLQAKGWHLV